MNLTISDLRLVAYEGLSFFISPTNGTVLEKWIDVEIKFNKSNVKNNTGPELLYWDIGIILFYIIEINKRSQY